MKKVDIGLDIGIASVGWAITDINTLEIQDYGVRLFPTVDDAKDSKLKNESRREARSARRQINRRKTLKRDFVKLLIDEKIISDIEFDKKGEFRKLFIKKYLENYISKTYKNDLPYIFFLRQEALSRELSKEELLPLLYWYINHRGFKYEVAGDDSDKDLIKLKEKHEKASKLPIEMQIIFFNENGYINGSFNRIFHSNEYNKEINKIFENQKLNKSFKDKFLVLFKRQRSFEDGPGNEITPTKYGRFYHLKNNAIIKRKTPLENIWEASVGRCTFYPREFRGPKKSLSSLIFNLLNELNNLVCKKTGEFLAKKNKIDILKIALQYNTSTNKIKNKLLEIFSLEKDDIDKIAGFSKDKSGKIKFTHLETYHLLSKYLPDKYTNFNYLFNDDKFNNNNIFDQIINIFSTNKSIEKRLIALNKKFNNILEDDVIKNISSIIFAASKTHSLSYKAMQKMIPDLIAEPRMNQMKWAKINDIKFNQDINYGTNYLKSDWIEDAIATPSVKRAFRQTTKVLNAIFALAKKENYHIRSIVIEVARETNNTNARKMKTDRQKYLENKRKDIEGQIEKLESSISNRTLEKLWLLEQQYGKDAYTGKNIKAEDVINKPGLFDIDHIIPYSQSFSNNRSNKVLTLQKNNHEKSNKTPKQYLSNVEFTKMKEIWREWYKNPKNKVFKDYEKFEFLTTNLDFSKPENQIGFIQRNLVDTRYTTKVILESLKAFANNKSNKYDFKVKAVNGKMTSFARNKISIKFDKHGKKIAELKRPKDLPLFEIDAKGKKQKSRIWNGHHAEDAYIVTVINSHYNDSKMIEKLLSEPIKYIRTSKNNINKKDWKEATINNNFQDLLAQFDIAREKLNKKIKEIKFSRMVEKPRNTKLFNETLYKAKIDINGTIDKYTYKDLLKEDFKANEFFGINAKKKDKLLIYKYNKNLYNSLNEIYLNYEDKSKNPFKAAFDESYNNGKHLILTFKNNKHKQVNVKIRKLRLISQTGKNPLRIIRAKDNGNSFYDSLEWVAIKIYKNKKDKYKIISVDASNHIFETKDTKVIWKEKHNVLEKQKEKKNIDLNADPVCVLYKGDLIKLPNDGEIVWVCGRHESQDKIEVKFLHRQKLKHEKSRMLETINTTLINSEVIKKNILGKNEKTKFIFK